MTEMRPGLIILWALFLIFPAWGCGGGGGGEEDGEEETDVESDDEVGEVHTDPDAVDGADDTGTEDFLEDDAVDAADGTDGEDGELPAECGNGIREEDEECDDGNDVDGDGCDGDCLYSCHDDGECGDGNICNGEETCGDTSHACEPGAGLEDGTVCGTDPRMICLSEACVESECGDGFVDTGGGESCEPPSTGTCDSECQVECEGDDDCVDDGNPCNGREYCDTTENRCAHEGGVADGTECQTTPRRICISGTCQQSLCGDGFEDPIAGEECDDGRNGDPDDGCTDACLYSCHDHGECDDGLACTDDLCDTGTHMCGNPVSADGTLCRPAAGDCDAAEYCDGTSTGCPADVFETTLTMCRAAADACDAAEYCTGTSAACPADAFLPSTTTCRGSAGDCDIAETCTGTSAACPADAFRTATVICRTSAGDCDLAESCTGTSALCPDDAFRPGTFLCRPAAGACDVEETCTGDSAACPDDEFEPSVVSCRGSAGVCDAAEYCSGTSALCPADAFLPSTTTCRISAGDCDPDENCTGTSASCPADLLHPSSLLCRPTAGTCDIPDYCTGTDPSCPGDNLRSDTYVCRTSAGACDVAERCTGLSPLCPDDAFETSTSVCRPAVDVCDAVEMCPGDGPGCPVDGFEPSTTACRAAVDLCDAEETCTGTSTTCPADGMEPATTVCRPAVDLCDLDDLCTGASVSCPADAKAPSGTGCDDGDYCTDPDQCDGSGVCEGAELALLYDIVSIAAGYYHTCAVTAGGGAMCWGYNDQGMLGDGTTTDSSVPVQVSGLVSGVAAITAGNFHTCALMDTGGVKCWGANSRGELGNGTFTASLVPVDVSGLSSGVIHLAAGTNHTCAVMSTGGIRCWGSNGYGQLGDGTTVGRNEPVDVQSLPAASALAVGPGWWHTCSLHAGGGVWCWGRNPDGQLGDGSTTDSLVPVAVSMTDVASYLATGARHNCVIVAAGAAKCWGFNLYGQLGDSSQTNRPTPVSVTGLASAVLTLHAGTNHTCAVLDSGALQCWGDNREGQLGDGTLVPKLVPVDVTGMGAGVSSAAGGHEHTCGLMDTAHVRCWGANDFGQLGDGTLTSTTSPTDVVCN